MATSRDEVLEGNRLQVRFRWEQDRYAHEVFMTADGGVRMLGSIEGSPEDAWPPSPPFQTLSIEERGAGLQVALLVGMAGKSHWSASVEFDARADRATFDVACRTPHVPQRLASRYACARPPHAESPARAVISPDHGQPFQLAVETLADVGAARLILAGNELAIEPLDVNSSAGAATIRWRYTIACIELDGAAR